MAGPKGRQTTGRKTWMRIPARESYMKGTRGFGMGGRGPVDLGTIFDQVFEAAREFQDEICKNINSSNQGDNPWFFNENTDYYPNYSYPPMNVCMTADRSLIFEFALAGFEEKDISLSFQGDYMVFSALIPVGSKTASSSNGETLSSGENIRYLKRRLKMKDVEKQKYFVPADKYAQEKVKAVFRNGILQVAIPPKEEPDHTDGIKIEIVSGD